MTTLKKTKKPKNKHLQLLSITLEPSEEEIFSLNYNFDRIIDSFRQGPIKKIYLLFPLTIIDQFIVHLQNFQDDHQFKQQILNMVVFFWRRDIAIVNKKQIIEKLLQGIIASILVEKKLSIDELRDRHFKIFRYLPDHMQEIFKNGLLEEAVKQSFRLTVEKSMEQCLYISNFFALMLLDDYVEVEPLMLCSLSQYNLGNKNLGLLMVNVLMNSPYNWIFEHQCRKFIANEFKNTIGRDLLAQQNGTFHTWDKVLIQINNVKSIQQLQQILQNNYDKLDQEKLGFASFRMTCFERHVQNVPNLLLQRFVEIKDDFNNTRWLQQFIRGIGLKKCKLTEEQSRAITEQINKNYKKFNAGQCQSILHKFVALRIDNSNTVKFLVEQLCSKIHETDLEALRKSVWTIGVLQFEIRKPKIKLVCQGILDRIDQAGEREYNQILRGLAEQSWKHSKFINLIKQRTQKLLQGNIEIPNQRIVNIFSSLARINCLDIRFLYIINNTLQYNKQFNLTSHDLVQLLLGIDVFINKGQNDEKTIKIFNNIIYKVLTIKRLQFALGNCKTVKISELISCFDGLIHLKQLKQFQYKNKNTNFEFLADFVQAAFQTNKSIASNQFKSIITKAEVLGISDKQMGRIFNIIDYQVSTKDIKFIVN